MKVEQIEILIDKYLAGTATAEEKVSLEQWYDRVEGEDGDFNARDLSVMAEGMKDQLLRQIRVPVVKPIYGYMKWAAAVIVIGLGAALFYFNQPGNIISPGNEYVSAGSADIPAGGNKAVLTLADGSTVVLNDAANGKLTSQGQVSITKTGAGLLSYAGNGAGDKEVAMNLLSTPRGGKYKIELSDGTKVWLNAATTLKYPAAFTGGERRVELSGEAYFEVAKNAKLPFRVVSSQQTIEVVGTHFNINAYAGEELIQSTLLEGSIKVSAAGESALLKPGQQSAVDHTNSIQLNYNVDTDEVTGWKNDLFQFESADIKTILNQFSRWYDVDIIYEGAIPSGHYHGTVSRDLPAAQALKVLNLSGIKFKIEGKKIIVK